MHSESSQASEAELVVTKVHTYLNLQLKTSSTQRLKAKNLFHMYNLLLPPDFKGLNYYVIFLFDLHSLQYQFFLGAFLIFTHA